MKLRAPCRQRLGVYPNSDGPTYQSIWNRPDKSQNKNTENIMINEWLTTVVFALDLICGLGWFDQVRKPQ